MGGWWPGQEQASRRSSLPNNWATTTANLIYHATWASSSRITGLVVPTTAAASCSAGGGFWSSAGKPIDWHRFDLMSFLFKLSITHFSVLSYRDKVKATNERHTYTRERNEQGASYRRTTWLPLQKESREIVTSTRYCRCVYAIKSFSISIQPLSRLNSAVKLRQSNSTLLCYGIPSAPSASPPLPNWCPRSSSCTILLLYLLYSSNEIMGGEMKGKIVGNLLKGYVITSLNKGQQQSEGRQGGGHVIYIQAGSVTWYEQSGPSELGDGRWDFKGEHASSSWSGR